MIKFTREQKTIYINPELITVIIPINNEWTEIYLGSEEHHVIVDQSEDEVIARLYHYKLNKSSSTGNYATI